MKNQSTKIEKAEEVMSDLSLVVTPIGVARTSMKVKFETPHQPLKNSGGNNRIELFEGSNFEQALDSLVGFDRIWLVWWFHKNKTWNPVVTPPRGSMKKRGVFATRSPHRPNPIGISSVPLLEIKGRTLFIGEVDLLDGTPILDIKPYLPAVDSFPDARFGWVEEIEGTSPVRAFTITYSARAQEQITWLENKGASPFWKKADELLAQDPHPHPTRRICRDKSGELRIACGTWRMFYSLHESTVEILSIESGYSMKDLLTWDDIPERQIMIDFVGMYS